MLTSVGLGLICLALQGDLWLNSMCQCVDVSMCWCGVLMWGFSAGVLMGGFNVGFQCEGVDGGVQCGVSV